MFTESKWEIIKSLSTRPKSPIELCQELNTTISNVSQQLKLLETANLVKKHKLNTRSVGKPRMVYSISKNYSYIVSAMEKFTDKRLINLDKYQEFVLRSWLFEKEEFHYYLEKFFWRIEDIIDDIVLLAVDTRNNPVIRVILVAKAEKYNQKSGEIAIKKSGNSNKKFRYVIYSDGDVRKNPGKFDSMLKDFDVVYDQLNLINKGVKT